MDPWASPALEAPLNEPTYLRVKRAIIGDLVSGQFVPGTHLTIEALTSRYAVSHMPIREALRQLEGEGILISLAHRGFRIEAITEEYIRNIYDIRVGIESMLAHRAVERATDAEVATLRRLHEDLSVLIRSGKPMVASRENIVFHKRIYEIAKNPEAELILEGRTRVVRTVADSLGGYTPDVYDAVIAEHEKMILAFEAHDPTAVGEAVFDHVTAARDRLLARISERGAFSAKP
ncbi:DNA-binding GntR family transcriptional regulator [Inquilinus ginsengisoli]|uniref:DNA-binding GntR family transcriptional regulator n=1 Tax=Inquilinus ginsengisoli TaxID=363840 RepID=A0ABU1JK92_9PROT|nr:GntR family transcriptional regulator [Inquilinus ginsengisoli]MDR6288434.1 DNA-binding GntR family transcriptional regulator [Inquilinus ginsengisoli]